MKKYLFLMAILVSSIAKAQTFDEWVNQKQTQIKYLLQQIAGNQIYIDYIQKGYKIASSGLQTIQHIKNGDFKLHSDFFASLDNVNPAIKKWSKVADIITMQVTIAKNARSLIQHATDSKEFTAAEITYLQTVMDHLLTECSKSLDDLISLISSGEVQMTDDERMKRISGIYDDMQDKLSFGKNFSKEASLLALQRTHEENEIIISKKLNGLQ